MMKHAIISTYGLLVALTCLFWVTGCTKVYVSEKAKMISADEQVRIIGEKRRAFFTDQSCAFFYNLDGEDSGVATELIVTPGEHTFTVKCKRRVTNYTFTEIADVLLVAEAGKTYIVRADWQGGLWIERVRIWIEDESTKKVADSKIKYQ